jgi:hypothetical protein
MKTRQNNYRGKRGQSLTVPANAGFSRETIRRDHTILKNERRMRRKADPQRTG